METIKTENLSKVYDGAKAVDGIDLTVEKGEVFQFIGSNGAGKTTTIGMMVGLIEPTVGKCFVRGVDVTRNPLEAKRITGYMPDGVAIKKDLTLNLKSGTGMSMTSSRLAYEARPGETFNIVASDYEVNVKVKSDQAEKEKDYRITIKTDSLIPYIGAGIIVLVVAGLFFIYRKYGRR